MDGFTHLQVHSYYSLLEATAPVEALVGRAAREGFTHLALTDTNALYGAVAFDRACRAQGIQPVLGMVVSVAWPGDLPEPGGMAGAGRLVLLARNPGGYRSLSRLSSLLQGRPDREAALQRGLALEDLREHSAGLICLSGGRRGWIWRQLRAGQEREARRFAGRLAGIFEQEFFLSLELYGAEDDDLARAATGLGAFLGVPVAAVQPVYTLEPEAASRLRLLAAIDRNCALDAVPASALPGDGDPRVTVHWLDAATIAERFAAYPEALACAGRIAARCAPALPVRRTLWPNLALPGGATPDTALAERARVGVAARYGETPAEPVAARLARELAAIARHGYAPLFLVVADIVRYARQHDIPVSTRGSVANSLVAYCIGITTVDPIAHDLLFERFLNPAREELPDIDLDFCSRRRDEVLDYVRRTYGADHVALVATISTLQLRSAVRETAKAYGVAETALAALLKTLPRGWHPDPRRRQQFTLEAALEQVEDRALREALTAAHAIVDLPHHLSVHPGGVVITPEPLTGILPVQWAPKGFLITQFDHHDVEALGLPKLDLLGIRALTVLAEAATLVRVHHDPGFRLADIPPDDAETGRLLSEGETLGVFQCESEGARRTLRSLRARAVRDLAVANAFFKPGPATGGMAETFIRRYRGEASVAYLHPALAPILAPTQGVLLFQEQVLRVATEIAGLSWAQANHLRRGMSHMQHGEMATMAAEFVAGCRRPPPEGPGFSAEQAAQLWEQVQAFSGYGFNQGHATAYADVSYRSAYLKAHWPAAFMAARLRNWGGYHHPAVYMVEAVRLGIQVRPPHVNASGRRATLSWEGDQPTLWMGLGQIRDLRDQSAAALIVARARAPFADLRDLLVRVPLRVKETAHLIQCGALDGLGESRAALLETAERLHHSGSARQLSFPFLKVSAPPETARQRFAWERQVLGFPLAALSEILPRLRRDDAQPASLASLAASPGRPGAVMGVRLPGWGRGSDCMLWDGETWALARLEGEAALPRRWEPARLQGRWLRAKWGMLWFRVEGWAPVRW